MPLGFESSVTGMCYCVTYCEHKGSHEQRAHKLAEWREQVDTMDTNTAGALVAPADALARAIAGWELAQWVDHSEVARAAAAIARDNSLDAADVYAMLQVKVGRALYSTSNSFKAGELAWRLAPQAAADVVRWYTPRSRAASSRVADPQKFERVPPAKLVRHSDGTLWAPSQVVNGLMLVRSTGAGVASDQPTTRSPEWIPGATTQHEHWLRILLSLVRSKQAAERAAERAAEQAAARTGKRGKAAALKQAAALARTAADIDRAAAALLAVESEYRATDKGALRRAGVTRAAAEQAARAARIAPAPAPALKRRSTRERLERSLLKWWETTGREQRTKQLAALAGVSHVPNWWLVPLVQAPANQRTRVRASDPQLLAERLLWVTQQAVPPLHAPAPAPALSQKIAPVPTSTSTSTSTSTDHEHHEQAERHYRTQQQAMLFCSQCAYTTASECDQCAPDKQAARAAKQAARAARAAKLAQWEARAEARAPK